jgi:Putative Ig domain/IPT/TIG domain
MNLVRLALPAILIGGLAMGCAAGSADKGLPTINSISPSTAVAGSRNTAITVSGVNLNRNTTILVNGSARQTTYLTTGLLVGVLTTADLASPGTLRISVAADPTNLVGFEVIPPPLEILTTSAPAATDHSPYSLLIKAQGGVAPYSWRVASGQLPDGLILTPSTGLISGIPTQVGEFSFTVEVADAFSMAVANLGIDSSAPAASQPLPPPEPPPTQSSGMPELPRSYLDTSLPTQTGPAINVSAGADLQAALNGANCGDTIQLAEGATFTGNFVLPVKGCDGWIVIRTSASDSSLPAIGTRVAPIYSAELAKIVSPNSGPAVSAQFGANHYRLIGIEITTSFSTLQAEQYGLVDFGEDPATGNSATSASELPYDITVDRCYIHGTPNGNVRRGITLNGASLAVIDSYISDIHVVGQDTQAIEGWNGPGPFKIVDNELEAAGENVMFGGALPTLVNNIPSDIEIRGNHFFKPLSWLVGSPSYGGIHWTVKNLLELKIAQRVLITGNILEDNWVDAQTGFAFLITPRTQSGAAPWIYVQDITFTYNVLRHTASAVNISGLDSADPQKLIRGRRILVQNDLFSDINGSGWGGGGGGGILFQVLSGSDAVTIDHNTGLQSGEIIEADGIPNTNFVYQNNITPHNKYGVMGSGYGVGMSTLDHYFPGFVFQKNAIENIQSSGASQSNYPPNTFFPPDWATVQFVDFASGNYALAPSSPYRNAGTDGKDLGADIAGLNDATASVIAH